MNMFCLFRQILAALVMSSSAWAAAIGPDGKGPLVEIVNKHSETVYLIQAALMKGQSAAIPPGGKTVLYPAVGQAVKISVLEHRDQALDTIIEYTITRYAVWINTSNVKGYTLPAVSLPPQA